MAYKNWPEAKKIALKDWIKSENHRNIQMLTGDVNHIPVVDWTTELVDRDEKDKFTKKTIRKIAASAGLADGDTTEQINTKLVKMIKGANDNKKAETAYEAATFMSFYFSGGEFIIDAVHENKKDVKVPVRGPSHKEQLGLPENPTIGDITQAVSEIGA